MSNQPPPNPPPPAPPPPAPQPPAGGAPAPSGIQDPALLKMYLDTREQAIVAQIRTELAAGAQPPAPAKGGRAAPAKPADGEPLDPNSQEAKDQKIANLEKALERLTSKDVSRDRKEFEATVATNVAKIIGKTVPEDLQPLLMGKITPHIQNVEGHGLGRMVPKLIEGIQVGEVFEPMEVLVKATLAAHPSMVQRKLITGGAPHPGAAPNSPGAAPGTYAPDYSKLTAADLRANRNLMNEVSENDPAAFQRIMATPSYGPRR